MTGRVAWNPRDTRARDRVVGPETDDEKSQRVWRGTEHRRALPPSRSTAIESQEVKVSDIMNMKEMFGGPKGRRQDDWAFRK